MALFKKNAKPENAKPASKRKAARAGFSALFRKEMSDHLNSVRFYMLFVVFIFISVLSINSSVAAIKASASSVADYAFLQLFTTNGETLYSLMTFIALLGPIVGIALGFDSISNERSLGTLNRLVAQPIYRDAVINAKFFAGAFVIGIMVLVLGIFSVTVGIFITGLVPNGDELARLVVFFVYAWIYMCVYLAISTFFSVLCKHAATAALSVIAIWLVSSLFMGQIANAIANALYPVSATSSVAEQMRHVGMNYAVNRISPYYLFNEASTLMLCPDVRSVGVVTTDQMVGAIDSALPFGQSLLLVWPHLIAMAAEAVVAFAAGYIKFMKQEIRG